MKIYTIFFFFENTLFHDILDIICRELKGEKSVYVVINFNYRPTTADLRAFENVPTQVQCYLTTSDQTLNK